MSKNSFNPRSRQEDQRIVQRKQSTFTGGMITDVEPSDLPNGAVSGLFNAISTGESIEGRKGTSPWTSLKLPYIIENEELTLTGDTLTSTNDFFENLESGFKVNSDEHSILFIRAITDSNTALVTGDIDTESTTPISLTNCSARGPINASFVDFTDLAQYYLIGTSIYARVGAAISWHEYFVVGEDIDNSDSSFYKIGDTIYLVNLNGIYRLSDITQERYAIQCNQELPTFKVNPSDTEVSSNPSAYNYAYSFVSMTGNSANNRRFAGNKLILETAIYLQDGETENDAPDYDVDGLHNDYTTVKTNYPITDSKYNKVSIDPSFLTPLAFVDLTEDERDPYIKFTTLTDTYTCYFDFSNVESLNDVAEEIERGLKLSDAEMNFSNHTIDGEVVFIVYHNNKDVTFDFDVSTATGYNMMLPANSCLTYGSTRVDMGTEVKYFRYPTGNYGITGYGIYRSKDIYPSTIVNKDYTDPRLQNNPDTFALIDDMPAACVFNGTISGTTLTVNNDNFKVNYIGNTISTLSNGDFNIVSVGTTPNTYEIDTSLSITGEDMYFGASDQTVLTKVLDKITASSNYVFSSADIGKVIFWADGLTSIIRDYDGANAYTVDDTSRASEVAVLNPTNVTYYDTATDVMQNGFLGTDPLRTRFFDKHDDIFTSIFSDGMLIMSSAIDGYLRYSDTFSVPTIGYHHKTDQYIDSVKEPVTALLPAGGNICIFTSTKTYVLNGKQSEVVITQFGEAYTVLPTPVLVHSSIGLSGDGSWASTDGGDVIVLTSEPAIRRFNGSEYVEDLADGRIQRSKIDKLKGSPVIDYDNNRGMTIWGIGEQDERRSI